MGRQVFFPLLWENLYCESDFLRKIKRIEKRKGARSGRSCRETRRRQIRHQSVGTREMRADFVKTCRHGKVFRRFDRLSRRIGRLNLFYSEIPEFFAYLNNDHTTNADGVCNVFISCNEQTRQLYLKS